jgi:serine protease Do
MDTDTLINKDPGRRMTSIGLLALTFLCGTLALPGHPARADDRDDTTELGRNSQPDSALELSSVFRQVAERVEPSVCHVRTYMQERTGVGEKTGSGFAIPVPGRTDATYVLTNNHVVADAVTIIAEFTEHERFPAEVVGTDALTDLAVLRIDRTDLDVVDFGDSGALQVGDWVVAVGCPLGLSQTVTAGIVSATNRQLGIIGETTGRAGYEDYIQTDAAINRGNSGGPLINLDGKVVGVNSVIVTRTGGSDGLGFAIPASIAKFIAYKLVEKGEIKRGFLGVGIQDITPALAESYGLSPDQKGVLLKSISDNSAAADARLQPEDLIVAIDGEAVTSAESLRSLVAMREPGSRVNVSVIRDGVSEIRQVVLGELEDDTVVPDVQVFDQNRDGRIGCAFQQYRDDQGAEVVRVMLGGPAHLAGLEARDLVVAVNSRPIEELIDGTKLTAAEYVNESIEKATSGSVVRLTVDRPRRVRTSARRLQTLYETFYIAVRVP